MAGQLRTSVGSSLPRRFGGKMQPDQFRGHLLTDENLEAGAQIRDLAGGSVDALVVLGSGLAGVLADTHEFGEPVGEIALSELVGVLAPVADGHEDVLRIHRVPLSGGGSATVAFALGRTHLYEGLGPDPVTALPRAAVAAGVKVAVLCNANGCLRDWHLGEVMTITDHANYTAISPFRGTVFLDTTRLWDPALADAMASVTQREGTYAILRGPEYQTPLETRTLAAAGVDAVGMSTVMEALMLYALGVKVAGLSVVSDLSFSEVTLEAEAVVETARKAEGTVRRAILSVLNAALGAGASQ